MHKSITFVSTYRSTAPHVQRSAILACRLAPKGYSAAAPTVSAARERLAGSCNAMDDAQRTEYARRMRRLLSPPEILMPDGEIDQEFFLPARFRPSKERYFAHEDREALAQALVCHGFGNWEAMRVDSRPFGLRLRQWTVEDLENAAKQLVGCADIGRYLGWQPANAAAIVQELEQNRANGLARGTWDSVRHWLNPALAASNAEQPS